MRSQKWTYPIDSAKKAIVTNIQIASCIINLLNLGSGYNEPCSLFPPDKVDPANQVAGPSP